MTRYRFLMFSALLLGLALRSTAAPVVSPETTEIEGVLVTREQSGRRAPEGRTSLFLVIAHATHDEAVVAVTVPDSYVRQVTSYHPIPERRPHGSRYPGSYRVALHGRFHLGGKNGVSIFHAYSLVFLDFLEEGGGSDPLPPAQGNPHGPGCEEEFVGLLAAAIHGALHSPVVDDPAQVREAGRILKEAGVLEDILDRAAPLCR